MWQGYCSGNVRANEVALNRHSGACGEGVNAMSVSVARNDVTCGNSRAADEGACACLNVNASTRISQSHGASDIGTNEVALHDVCVSLNCDADKAVSRDQVARCRRGAANGIVRRAVFEKHAAAPVGTRHGSGRIGTDEISCDYIVLAGGIRNVDSGRKLPAVNHQPLHGAVACGDLESIAGGGDHRATELDL